MFYTKSGRKIPSIQASSKKSSMHDFRLRFYFTVKIMLMTLRKKRILEIEKRSNRSPGLVMYKECQIPKQLRRYLIGNP